MIIFTLLVTNRIKGTRTTFSIIVASLIN